MKVEECEGACRDREAVLGALVLELGSPCDVNDLALATCGLLKCGARVARTCQALAADGLVKVQESTGRILPTSAGIETVTGGDDETVE
jgi:hypothetical protein